MKKSRSFVLVAELIVVAVLMSGCPVNKSPAVPETSLTETQKMEIEAAIDEALAEQLSPTPTEIPEQETTPTPTKRPRQRIDIESMVELDAPVLYTVVRDGATLYQDETREIVVRHMAAGETLNIVATNAGYARNDCGNYIALFTIEAVPEVTTSPDVTSSPNPTTTAPQETTPRNPGTTSPTPIPTPAPQQVSHYHPSTTEIEDYMYELLKAKRASYGLETPRNATLDAYARERAARCIVSHSGLIYVLESAGGDIYKPESYWGAQNAREDSLWDTARIVATAHTNFWDVDKTFEGLIEGDALQFGFGCYCFEYDEEYWEYYFYIDAQYGNLL